MNKKMLDRAYDLDGADATQAFYDDWAETYEAEVAENGYATPARCAAALKSFAPDTAEPILDIDCGTGISGQALCDAGFEHVEGCDFSAEMLKHAQEKEIYRSLHTTDLQNPFPFSAGQFAQISAMGVLNPGHAPASTLDDVLSLLNPGGHFVLSLNDHALADSSYEARINENIDTGHAALLFKEYGDHLPKIGLNSNVYVLQKL